MSDILDAVNKANEPKKRAIVNHNGSCDGYHYQMEVEIDLPLSVIAALGENVQVVGEAQVQSEQPAQSQASAPAEQPSSEQAPTDGATENNAQGASADTASGSDEGENK